MAIAFKILLYDMTSGRTGTEWNTTVPYLCWWC